MRCTLLIAILCVLVSSTLAQSTCPPLGHELGHLAARQQALDMSRNFREVLGVKSISPDEDLFGLYSRQRKRPPGHL